MATRARTGLDQISAEIGGLKVHVETLKAASERQERQNGEILRKLDQVSVRQHQVDHIEREVAAMKPITEDYQRVKQKALGVGAVLSVFFAAVGAVFAMAWDGVKALIFKA